MLSIFIIYFVTLMTIPYLELYLVQEKHLSLISLSLCRKFFQDAVSTYIILWNHRLISVLFYRW
jgi:hypothetical protein